MIAGRVGLVGNGGCGVGDVPLTRLIKYLLTLPSPASTKAVVSPCHAPTKAKKC